MSATASELTFFELMKDGVLTELFRCEPGVFRCTINWPLHGVEWVEASTPKDAAERALAKVVAASLAGERIYNWTVEAAKRNG